MRARIDKTGENNIAALIEAAYSNSFFAELARLFPVELGKSDVRAELNHIARIYVALRRTENSPELRKEMRKDYLQLGKQTDGFLGILRAAPQEDLAFAIYMAALRFNEPIPATKFAGLSGHAQTNTGEPYLLELLRLLELLKNAAKEQADHFRERPGPKINLGLEFLVRRVADLFEEIDRPFSIDHHKPVPTGPAMDFVRALIAPLDDVSDTEISTAIRTEQNRRRSRAEKD